MIPTDHPYITTKPKGVRHINVLQSAELMRKEHRVNSVIQIRGQMDKIENTQNPSFVRKKYDMSKSIQKSLNIVKRDIKYITVNMLNMNLKEIDFSDNKIVYFPDEICNLNNLTKLVSDRNHLRMLPDGIGKLKSLKTLSLCDN